MDKCKGAARLRPFYLRQRKEGFGEIRYSVSTMNGTSEIFETTVESFMKSTPKSIRFFLDWHLACTGCGFARFCKLGDVVKTYQLDEKKFLEEAQKFVVQQS